MHTPYDGPSTFLATANQEPLAGNRGFSPAGLLGSSRVSAMPVVAADGSINGYNVAEVMQNIGLLMSQASAGGIQEAKASARQNMESKLAKRQALAAAMHSRDKDTQEALAEVMGEMVYETLGRAGFSRKFLTVKPIANGTVHQIPVIVPDVTSVFTTENANVPASQIRGKYIQPKPFAIDVNVLIDEMEIATSPVDLLDIKYNQALEQGLVGEDRVFVRLADAASKIHNVPVFFDTLSPTILTSVRTQIDTQGGIPVGGMLISADIWADIIAETEFQNFYSPIEKHEIVLSGRLGTLMGMDIVTDGFRIPNLKVLNQGTLFVFGVPDTLGELGQYGQMTATAVDRKQIGEAKRGWFLQNILDMTIANTRAVVKAQRI
jgi:hypothetical protein